jgi:hypothetical protein
METAATARGVPHREASSGVRRLPIPKPVTEATAPAASATATRTAWKITRLLY